MDIVPPIDDFGSKNQGGSGIIQEFNQSGLMSDLKGVGDKMIASTQKNMQLEDYRVYALAILNQNQNEGLFSSIQSLKANTDSCVDEGACTLQLHIHGISISLTML